MVMRRQITLLMMLAAMLACGTAAFAATNDRFKGGSYDGWDSGSLLQADTNLFNARFAGGSYDGYDEIVSMSNAIPPIRGTFFYISEAPRGIGFPAPSVFSKATPDKSSRQEPLSVIVNTKLRRSQPFSPRLWLSRLAVLPWSIMLKANELMPAPYSVFNCLTMSLFRIAQDKSYSPG